MSKRMPYPDLPALDPALLDQVRSVKPKMTIIRKKTQRIVDSDWLETIEDSLPSLEAAIREPMYTLSKQEDIRPAERSRRISPRADLYLARHTEHLHTDADGQIRPAKLPNVRREETLQVYENRFLNTLIRRLYAFVDRRYRFLCAESVQEQCSILRVELTLPDRTCRERILLEFALSEEEPVSTLSPELDRVKHLRQATDTYCHGAFAMRMGDQTVRAPILPTNAIMQNKHLQKCLSLFRYLEQYREIGCRVDVTETVEHPDESCLREFYPLMTQYLTVSRRAVSHPAVPLATTERQVIPHLTVQTEESPTSSFDVTDTEYRRIFAVSFDEDSYRYLSADERGICRALESALEADAVLRRADVEHLPDPAERVAVNLDILCEYFSNGSRITPELLMEKHLIHRNARHVKILSSGEIRKTLHITADAFSADARRCIEQVGGTCTVRRHKQ